MLTDIAQEKALALVSKGFDNAIDQLYSSKGFWNWLTRKSTEMWLKAAQGNVREKVSGLSKSLSGTIKEQTNSGKIRNQVHGRVG